MTKWHELVKPITLRSSQCKTKTRVNNTRVGFNTQVKTALRLLHLTCSVKCNVMCQVVLTFESVDKTLVRDLSKGHFRITFSLFLKASLGAHPFI